MNSNVLHIFTLLILVSSCSQKPLLRESLKRTAIVEVKLKPEVKTSLINDNSIQIDLSYTLNNGSNKSINRKASKLQNKSTNLTKYSFSSKNTENQWKYFNVTVQNGRFKNGVLSFDRNRITTNNHEVKIKIKSKNSDASDSLSIKIPYVESVKLKYREVGPISPGYELPIDLEATYNTGEKQCLPAHVYTLQMDGIAVTEPLNFTIPIRNDFYATINLKGIYKSESTKNDSLVVPLKFNAFNRYYFNGEDGRNGVDGENGFGLIDLNGRDGRPGQNGQHGRRAPWVNIYLKSFYHEDRLLIEAVAKSAQTYAHCFFDPQFGSLEINSNGGDGGNGGSGGRGAPGACKTDKTPAGYRGIDGNGGNGGDGGDGGVVKIYADRLAAEYLSNVKINNLGGKAGAGGNSGLYSSEDLSRRKSLFETFFPVSTGTGVPGMHGAEGNSGPEPEVIVLDINDLSTKLNR